MNTTLGAPSGASGRAGQAGVDVSTVRPMAPGNGWSGGYWVSSSAIGGSPHRRPGRLRRSPYGIPAVSIGTALPFRQRSRPGRSARREEGLLMATTDATAGGDQ